MMQYFLQLLLACLSTKITLLFNSYVVLDSRVDSSLVVFGPRIKHEESGSVLHAHIILMDYS